MYYFLQIGGRVKTVTGNLHLYLALRNLIERKDKILLYGILI